MPTHLDVTQWGDTAERKLQETHQRQCSSSHTVAAQTAAYNLRVQTDN
jgi:hypothetical protein